MRLRRDMIGRYLSWLWSRRGSYISQATAQAVVNQGEPGNNGTDSCRTTPPLLGDPGPWQACPGELIILDGLGEDYRGALSFVSRPTPCAAGFPLPVPAGRSVRPSDSGTDEASHQTITFARRTPLSTEHLVRLSVEGLVEGTVLSLPALADVCARSADVTPPPRQEYFGGESGDRTRFAAGCD